MVLSTMFFLLTYFTLTERLSSPERYEMIHVKFFELAWLAVRKLKWMTKISPFLLIHWRFSSKRRCNDTKFNTLKLSRDNHFTFFFFMSNSHFSIENSLTKRKICFRFVSFHGMKFSEHVEQSPKWEKEKKRKKKYHMTLKDFFFLCLRRGYGPVGKSIFMMSL